MSDAESSKNSPRSEGDASDHMDDGKGDESIDKSDLDPKKVTIYVGDLPRDADERDVRDVFEKRGKLSRCDIKTKRGRYCFVEYDDDSIAEKVLAECEKDKEKITIKGHRVKVEPAKGKKEQRCFNCNKPGHKKADCPEAPRHSSSRYRRRSGHRHSHSRSRSRSRSHRRRHSPSRSRSRSRSHSRHSHSRHYRRSHSRSDSRDRYRSHSRRDRDDDRDRERRDRDSDRRSSRHEERKSSHRDSRRSRSMSGSPRR